MTFAAPHGLRGIAAAVLIAFAVMPLSIAHADGADDQFLAALAAQGITGDNAALIAQGRAACDNYGSAAIVGQSLAMLGMGLNNMQASQVITDGWHIYCPGKSGVGAALPGN